MRMSPVALLALVASCGGTVVDPTDVRARIVTDLGKVLAESKAAYGLTSGTLPGAVLRGYLPGLPSLPAATGLDPDAAISWLTDQLFTDAHYLGDGVYRFPAELVCATDDPACVTSWDAAQVRIRVVDDDGLRFWIQIGAAHAEPIELTLRRTELAVTADLDGANLALVALAPAFGVSTDGAAIAGAITADLNVLAAADVRATLSFDRPIRMALAGSKLVSAAATVATLELAEVLKASLALGATTIHTASTNQDLDLPGATFEVSSDGGLAFDHVSLGTRTTTISVGGILGKTIDLNPHAGRSFSVTLDGDLPGEAETALKIVSQVELLMTTNHTVLGDQASTYDVTRLVLDGWISLTASELDVVDGSFLLTTNPDPYSFTATKDQCASMVDGSEHVVATCSH